MKIEVGQIYEIITDDFITSGDDNKFGNRQVKLKKGEKIEIRYPYEWHFRTEDNIYFHAKPEMIEDNCIIHSNIWENVRFGNRCKLKDILKLGLCKVSKEYIKYKSDLENEKFIDDIETEITENQNKENT